MVDNVNSKLYSTVISAGEVIEKYFGVLLKDFTVLQNINTDEIKEVRVMYPAFYQRAFRIDKQGKDLAKMLASILTNKPFGSIIVSVNEPPQIVDNILSYSSERDSNNSTYIQPSDFRKLVEKLISKRKESKDTTTPILPVTDGQHRLYRIYLLLKGAGNSYAKINISEFVDSYTSLVELPERLKSEKDVLEYILTEVLKIQNRTLVDKVLEGEEKTIRVEELGEDVIKRIKEYPVHFIIHVENMTPKVAVSTFYTLNTTGITPNRKEVRASTWFFDKKMFDVIKEKILGVHFMVEYLSKITEFDELEKLAKPYKKDIISLVGKEKTKEDIVKLLWSQLDSLILVWFGDIEQTLKYWSEKLYRDYNINPSTSKIFYNFLRETTKFLRSEGDIDTRYLLPYKYGVVATENLSLSKIMMKNVTFLLEYYKNGSKEQKEELIEFLKNIYKTFFSNLNTLNPVGKLLLKVKPINKNDNDKKMRGYTHMAYYIDSEEMNGINDAINTGSYDDIVDEYIPNIVYGVFENITVNPLNIHTSSILFLSPLSMIPDKIFRSTKFNSYGVTPYHLSLFIGLFSDREFLIPEYSCIKDQNKWIITYDKDNWMMNPFQKKCISEYLFSKNLNNREHWSNIIEIGVITVERAYPFLFGEVIHSSRKKDILEKINTKYKDYRYAKKVFGTSNKKGMVFKESKVGRKPVLEKVSKDELEKMEIDHLIPKKQGGQTTLYNLFPMESNLNRSKGDKINKKLIDIFSQYYSKILGIDWFLPDKKENIFELPIQGRYVKIKI